MPTNHLGDVSTSDEKREVDPSGYRLEVSLELKLPSDCLNWEFREITHSANSHVPDWTDEAMREKRFYREAQR